MLFGSFVHSLDEKSRLVIPNKFRNELSDKLYILKGFDGCLNLYSEDCFKIYLDNLAKLDCTSKPARDILRVALSSVVELQLDSKNRVVLPTELLKRYNISSSITVVGMIDHLEIWDSDKWSNYLKDNETEFENKFEELRSKANG